MIGKRYILEFNEMEFRLVLLSLIFHLLFFKGHLNSLVREAKIEMMQADALDISSDLKNLINRLEVL